MTQGRSGQGPSGGESREKLVKFCERAAYVLDGITSVSSVLHDKGPAIAVITGPLAWAFRYAAWEAGGR